jgi:hypothetical protein
MMSMKSPEQEHLERLLRAAQQWWGEASEKAQRASEAKDLAYREKPSPDEAVEYLRLSDLSSHERKRAVEAEEKAEALRAKLVEANIAAMIEYQAKAVAKHIRPTLWLIQVLLLVLVLVIAYATHQLPHWLAP